MLLSALQHAQMHNVPALQEMAGASAVLEALSSSSPSTIHAALLRAKDNGVALPQVGALALFAHRPLVADALRQYFDIKIEDYLTTGGEPGIDASEGYPLLPALAYMRDEVRQMRALRWGADPSATWEVPRRLGGYAGNKNTPVIISWISEAIRGLTPHVVLSLLEVCSDPPDQDEEDRRLRSLQEATTRLQRNGNPEMRLLVNILGPGGAHALKRSYWDIPCSTATMGVELSCSIAECNPHFDHGACLSLFDEWIRSTIPSTPTAHQEVLLYKLKGKVMNRYHLPQWCVENVSPHQAQEVLGKGWGYAVEQVSSKMSGRDLELDCGHIERSLSALIGPMRSLLDRAQELPFVGPELCSPPVLLGRLFGEKNSPRITTPLLEAIINLWPRNPADPSFTLESVDDLKELLLARTKLKKEIGNLVASASQKSQMEELGTHVASILESYALRSRTPPPSSPTRLGMPRL